MKCVPEGRQAILEAASSLLMPADAGKKGVLVDAGGAWSLDTLPEAAATAEVVMWGQAPPAQVSVAGAVVGALRRELAISRIKRVEPGGLSVRNVYRLPPPLLRAGVTKTKVGKAVLSGALVEMASNAGAERVLDVALRTAGASPAGSRFQVGSGGGVLVHARVNGAPALVRVGTERGAREIARAADALQHIAGNNMSLIPQLMRRGESHGAVWSVESLLPGRRPRRLGRRILGDVARFCSALPRTEGAPEAPREDFGRMCRYLPQFDEPLTTLMHRVQRELAHVRGMMRHGDLWAGNLLVRDGTLVGVVDWDAWHPSGAPGTDLLYTTVTDQWLRSRRRLGEIWRSRPWQSAAFAEAGAPYWRALDILPSAELLEAVGLSAWAAQVATSLDRSRQLASNSRWVHNTVGAVIRELED
jgi:hypothetical protein